MPIFARAFLILVISVAVSGCANFSRGVLKSETPSAGSAYIYGRFEISTATAMFNIGIYKTIGLSLACGSGKELLIKLKVEDPVQIFAIDPPGTCVLKEIVHVSDDLSIKGKSPPPTGWAKEIRLSPGTATYIGNFYGRVYGAKQGSGTTTITSEFLPSLARDDFTATTQQLKLAFPRFAEIPAENRSLVK